MKIHALVLGILLMAAPAFAAPVDGKWTGTIDTPNGPVQVGFTFKADAGALTLPSSIWPEVSADNRFTGDSLSGRHERIFALRCWNTGSDSGEHTDPLPTEENASVAGVNCL